MLYAHFFVIVFFNVLCLPDLCCFIYTFEIATLFFVYAALRISPQMSY